MIIENDSMRFLFLLSWCCDKYVIYSHRELIFLDHLVIFFYKYPSHLRVSISLDRCYYNNFRIINSRDKSSYLKLQYFCLRAQVSCQELNETRAMVFQIFSCHSYIRSNVNICSCNRYSSEIQIELNFQGLLVKRYLFVRREIGRTHYSDSFPTS